MHSKNRVPLRFTRCMLMLTVLAASSMAAASDQVLDWIGIMNDTVIAGAGTPLATTRTVAMLSSAVFDAVNGIEPHYQSLLVKPNAPPHASRRAAAIQAAYAMLLKAYPAQAMSLGAHRDASIAALSPPENANSIQAGVTWGQTVADTIFALRSADGISPPPPPFVGVLGMEALPSAVGVWRPTPLLNLPAAGPQFATMTPWVLRRPSQFRLPPPPALTSPEYTADYNEIKIMGAASGSMRSKDQSDLALFWAGNTPLYWNRIAAQLSLDRHFSLLHNARLFALLNVSMADAGIACWDGKYRYVFWRPITAIRLGDSDKNPDTAPDALWTPWLDYFPTGTPNHPEYPSGHSTVSGAATFVLAAAFGDDTAFSVTSDVMPGTRSFTSFSSAVAEIADARVFGGIHFRTSCVRANALGQAVANYVSKNAMRARNDDDQ